jgi:hypothetical protein
MGANRNTALRDRMRARVKATRAACALCGEPINYDLPHSDPKSFVIDHIESLHAGGADALSNIQAAHRRPATATVPKAQASCGQLSDEAGPSTEVLHIGCIDHRVTHPGDPLSGLTKPLRGYAASFPVGWMDRPFPWNTSTYLRIEPIF